MNVSLKLFGKLITIDIANWADERAMRREWHKNGIWVTKEGRKISVEKMSDGHLINVFFMLERRAERLSITVWAYPYPRGEMAQDAYDLACMDEDVYGKPSKEQVLSKFAIYPHLVKELKRRGF